MDPSVSTFVKVHVDASWSRLNNSRFVAVVAQDARGEFIAAARYHISASCVAMAEALALLCGCELANGNWEAFPILANAWDLGETFQNCRWSWVPRSANMAADSLASFCNLEMCNVVWVNRPPSSLIFVLNNDGIPCPH
ncbi:hypothetical protein EV2_029295 [Malus domestica]